ncbi:TPA: ATP-dependent DNA helicase DinG [Vibrio parahaemolyticus]|uniref:ATP-dependent DNA helicase DinG n=1 Tax=Vibrio campbellii TaxID=680 RepID=UPI001F078E9A|nr:ATP-dependent DNA helicase DinG [Vibrio campbellii]UMM06631.1 ATP-dependent DNA helicase DinG [Vibrio campbellii]
MSQPDLNDATKAEIRKLYKAVQASLPGFKPRKEQTYLIAEIAKTLGGCFQQSQKDKRIIACEAGTGTGKTFAYLIPGIVMAQKLNKKLIVSTANVSLQSQLELKDLPLLQRVMPNLKFRVALGRNRYLCRRDVENVAGGVSDVTPQEIAMFGQPEQQEPLSSQDSDLLERMVQQFDSGAWDGVHDNWTTKGEVINQALWNRVNCKSGTCTKRVCPYFEECAFMKARKELEEVDVIVSNHALTMASVASGANVLPEPEEAIWVMDEAHHIPKQYRDSFEQRVTIEGSLKWLKKVPSTVGKASLTHGQDVSSTTAPEGKELDGIIRDLVTELQNITDMLLANCKFTNDYSEEQNYRFKDGLLPSVLATSLKNLSLLSGKVNRCVGAHASKLQECIEKKQIPSSPAIEKTLADINRMQLQAESFYNMWQLFMLNEQKGSAIAKWITCGGNGKPDLAFNAVPITVAEELKEALWDKAAGAVVTSATVTSLGNFDRFMLESGLKNDDGTQYRRVTSPFDYQNQSTLIVPKMQVDPTLANEETHTQEIAHYAEQMGKKHNAMLLLFTSYRQLNRFKELVSAELKADMLIQNEDTRPNLIRQHKERVDAGMRSILVGVASLGEGLDLPAQYLTCVGIAKIPFANFTAPVDEAEGEWIKKRGGNPFFEQSLPEASARLIQQVGRLIRSTSCSGEVLIFDRRLSSKKYGAQLLDSLPPMKLVA